MILVKVRAAIFFAALCFFTGVLSSAAPESYKDTILKARNLVLQKDRQQAQLILTSALKAEKINSKAHKEIRTALGEISQVFLSDKTQQLHELSLTLKRTDLTQAQQKLAEALRIEPDNLVLLLESIRQNILRNDCKAAEEISNKAKPLNLFDEELNLASAQANICMGNFIAYQKAREQGRSVQNNWLWVALDLDRHVKEKNLILAKEDLAQLKKIQNQHPEISYWIWKLDLEQKINNIDAAQKYLVDCRNLPMPMARKLNQDPWLCRHTQEVEAYIKNSPTT